MEVSGQLNTPADLSLGKELPVPILLEAGWRPRAGLDAVAKRKGYLQGIEPHPIFQPVAQSLYY